LKALAMMLLIIWVSVAPAAAAPASPIWSVSVGVDGNSPNYFVGDYYPTSKLFQNNETKYLTISATVNSGTRFSLGYGSGRNDTLGYENKTMIAGVGQKIAENWWVTVGYESGRSSLSGFNLGAVYHISPNAAMSIGSQFTSNDFELKNAVLRTQLYIRF